MNQAMHISIPFGGASSSIFGGRKLYGLSLRNTIVKPNILNTLKLNKQVSRTEATNNTVHVKKKKINSAPTIINELDKDDNEFDSNLSFDKSLKELLTENDLLIKYKKGDTVFEAPDKTKVKLTQNQQKMLKYHSKLKRIPRKFISVFEETVRYLLNNKYGSGTYDLVFGGSYRRGAKDSGDIDIIIKSTHFNLKNFIELLEKNKLVFDTLSLGNHDFKGLGRCPGMKDFIFRIDVLFTKEVNWIAALNHYTGNDVLNRLLREKAQKIRNWEGKKLPYGAILSQNGLFIRNSNSVSSKKRLIKGGLKTEKQLFDILGIKYLTPTKRGTK